MLLLLVVGCALDWTPDGPVDDLTFHLGVLPDMAEPRAEATIEDGLGSIRIFDEALEGTGERFELEITWGLGEPFEAWYAVRPMPTGDPRGWVWATLLYDDGVDRIELESTAGEIAIEHENPHIGALAIDFHTGTGNWADGIEPAPVTETASGRFEAP